MPDGSLVRRLECEAARCRRNIIRMIRSNGAGHLGGTMGCTDIMTALYFHAMNVDPSDPSKPDRDRFVLSAGHKCMALYAVLAERGFFDKSHLDTYGHLNTKLPGHPDMHKLSGIEANTGSMGHGLSISVGMALGLRDTAPDARVFTVLGDGELTEGSNWEAASAAAHYRLDNLTVIIDVNGLQISGPTAEVMNMEPIAGKFAAFGWETRDTDGHDMAALTDVLGSLPFAPLRPSAIIARTIKGRGLKFAEGSSGYHYWKPKEDELAAAECELDESIRLREAS